MQGPFAGGMGIMIGVFLSAGASGGHCNPAVSLGMWTLGRLDKSFLKGTFYLFARVEIDFFIYRNLQKTDLRLLYSSI